MSINYRRPVAAFLLSPVVGAVAFLAIWLVLAAASGNELQLSTSDVIPALGWFFALPLAIGFAAEILIGAPLLKLFLSKGWLSTGAFAAGGLLIGLLISVAVYWDEWLRGWNLVLCLVPATVASVFFGAIGGWASRQGARGAAESVDEMPPAPAREL